MKTENRPKTSLNSSHTNALSQGTIFAKNANFLQEKKKKKICKIKRDLILKGIFSRKLPLPHHHNPQNEPLRSLG